jgi:hypothetical protein
MLFFAFRKVIFDLIVEKQEFISGMGRWRRLLPAFSTSALSPTCSTVKVGKIDLGR